tara:strand:+ start:7665 stop:8099 length:435 start_codon:yes stop_codon:yes gene_type:complete
MELDNIDKIIAKYFEATTTVAEEKTLKAYFSQGDVAPHLEKYAPMFTHFSNAKKEQYTKQLPLKTKKRKPVWMSIAAVAVLLFGMYLGNNYLEEKRLEKEQAEYAYQQTKKALNLLAENFSRGTEKVAYLKEFEQSKRKIYNNH